MTQPLTSKYSAGGEKSPYFLFHGETALHQILRFQGETANFWEKFQGKIQVFPGENMSLIGKILKFQGEIQVFPGENIGFPGEIFGFPGEIFHYFSQFLPEKKAVDHGEK